MLPSRNRLRRGADFHQVVRRGQAARRTFLTVHVDLGGGESGPLAGLIVSRAVGGAVVRHQISRRLRHVLTAHLAALSPDVRLVVRAAPAAAQAPTRVLARDVESALHRALGRARQRVVT